MPDPHIKAATNIAPIVWGKVGCAISVFMVEFIIDRNGTVISTRVLHPHPKTSITLSNSDKKFIEKDCKAKFKFTPSSSAKMKDRVFKQMEYTLE